jgi:hypothetical protein
VHVVVTIMTVVLAAVNVFGAWAVVRRRGFVARLFMLAAAVLVVAAVAYSFRFTGSFWILLTGTLVAYLASFLNARVVIGVVEWPNHAARAVVFAAYLALAWLSVG